MPPVHVFQRTGPNRPRKTGCEYSPYFGCVKGSDTTTARGRWAISDAVFGLLILAHALPLLTFRWFPTLDGPGHLYNASIIRSLWTGDDFIGRFFEVNPFPEPNWLGHAVAAAVMVIAPAHLAEKMVALLFVVGLPLAFRFAVRRIAGQAGWACVLVFPFIYGFTFRIGFLNFSLALVVLLLTIGLGHAFLNDGSARNGWRLGLLMLVLYFAHLTSFLLGLAVLLGIPFWQAITIRSASSGGWRSAWKGMRGVLLCAAPTLMLAIAFFLSHEETRTELQYLPIAERWTWLLNGRPFVSLNSDEEPLARTFAWVMAGLALCAGFRHITGREQIPTRTGWLLAVMTAMIVAFFVLPDQMATGSFASVRLLLFAYLFMALWLAVQRFHRSLLAVAVMIYLLADLLLLGTHFRYTRDLNNEVQEMLAVAPALPENAFVVPLNYGDNWLHSNFSCYMGATNGVVIADNFCALVPHNPVLWEPDMIPNNAIGNYATSGRPCVDLDAYVIDGDTLVDHVLTWKLHDEMSDSCTVDVRRQLATSFTLVASSPNGSARLYRRRE